MAKKQLGKYDIIERLGRGGMAEVYKAYQPSLDRFVAIKLLHPFLADDPEFKDRFEREARNVARLRHPNIVQVYDFEYDQDSESYYMVMELIDGQTLKDRLTELGDRLAPINETLRIMRGATEALAYAHARGMIHRDVKPANLMLDSDGRIVLTDFGIAKIVTGIQFTASGGMVGTPAYMAPEQGLGDAGDERSDLYSLGIILFQLVTGRLPYNGDTPLSVILKHLNEPIPSSRALNPDLPPEVEHIIDKTMAKDPEDRYPSAEAMLQEINAAAGVKAYDTRPISTTTARAPSPDSVGDEAVLAASSAGGTSGGTPGGSNGSGKDDTAARRGPMNVEPPSLATSTAIRPPARTSWAGLGAIAVVALMGWFILTTLATGKTPLFAIVVRPSDTPTPTGTPTQTPTWTPSPSNTPTFTLTPTVPTDTPTATSTPLPTDTPLPTATLTPSVTLTPSDTLTPTPNLTQTIAAGTTVSQNVTATSVQATLNSFFLTQQSQTTPTVDYTSTMQVCIKDYRIIVDKTPQQDPIKADTDFTRQIVLKNTSNCDWIKGAYLKFSSGERFGAPQTIQMQNLQTVKPGDNATFNFQGHTPKRGGLYSGVWEVRLAGDVLISQPLTISFFAYE